MSQRLMDLVISRTSEGSPASGRPVLLEDLKQALKDRVEIKTLLEAAEGPGKESENPLQPLVYLKEAGLDLGSVTSTMKNVAEVYKDMAVQEREARAQAEKEAKEVKVLADTAQAKIFEMLLTVFMQERQRSDQLLVERLEHLAEKLSEKKESEPDPLTRTLQEGTASLLAAQLQNVLNPPPRRSRLEELAEEVAMIDRLYDIIRPRREEPNIPAASDERLALELYKLKLEDEREREKARREQELQEKRLHAIQAGAELLKSNLGDFLRAVAETAQAMKQQPPATQQPAPQMPPPGNVPAAAPAKKHPETGVNEL